MKNKRYFIPRLLVVSLSFLNVTWASDTREQQLCNRACGSICHNSGYDYVRGLSTCMVTKNTTSAPGNISCTCFGGPQGVVNITVPTTQVQTPKQKQASRKSSIQAKEACLASNRTCALSKAALTGFCVKCRQGTLVNKSTTINGQTFTCSQYQCSSSTFPCHYTPCSTD